MRYRGAALLGGALFALSLTAGLAAGKPTPRKPAPAPTAVKLSLEKQAEFFETSVRPVLFESCTRCHGPAKQLAQFRVDSLEALLKGGARGPAIIPGKPSESLLLQAISYTHPSLKMPPTKKIKDADIKAIGDWIRQGAHWPDYGKGGETPNVKLWSVEPLRRPAIPTISNLQSTTSNLQFPIKNPIDSFVLAQLRKKGLTPAPPAGKLEILRRLYFDLTGLPPTPQEVASYFADKTPDAYERLVDRLLVSPRYGERWARYWLDLVRYADSNGYERDAEKKYSWKYRDYVIKALNEDKPYDRFITEQLAGDELPDKSEETLAATGFLRLGTWDDEPNDALEYRYERLDDLVHASGTAFLALTIKCARCHDHKFDPIPQKDYYAFGAAFYGGWLEGGVMGGPPDKELPYPVLGFTDKGRDAPPLHLLEKGDPRREGPVVPPAFPSLVPTLQRPVLPSPTEAKTTTRRLQLAAWLTDPRNPLTARVFVNRIWQHHFGEGLVRTPNNFGRKGDVPTHPELLDWLANDFTANGWKIKRMHRQIVLSSAYRMASVHPQQAAYNQKDASNFQLWRQNRRRLDADAIRDSMLAVSGELNLKEGGPGFFSTVQREALEGLSRKGAEWPPSSPDEQRRRTVYMFLKRSLIMPLLSIHDFPDTTAPVEARDSTLVAPQALALLNNPFVHERAKAFALRVAAEAGADPSKRVERAWRLAVGRSPSARELALGLEHLRITRAAAQSDRSASSDRSDKPSANKLALWLKADQGVTADAQNRVSRWTDQGGGGHDASQAAEAAQPTLVTNALNGKPVLRFDGKGRFLNLAGQVLTSQQFTLIAVVNDGAPGSGYREVFSNWYSKSDIGQSLFLGLTGNSIRLSDHLSPAGALSQPEKHFILTGVNTPHGAMVYQDRREAARRATPLPTRNFSTPYVVGQQGNINGEYWKGDIAEILAYDRDLSETELAEVWDYLSGRYGIALRPKKADPGLASLCRVLLNSNEFIYVD